ncbi:MAG: hypothetical protein R3E01_25215 [Pirellulaceae bacterium]
MKHVSIFLWTVLLANPAALLAEPLHVLRPGDYQHYIENFNRMEPETVVNQIPNRVAWDWLKDNAPFFDCPAKQFEETYYFRWWSFRKHIKSTPDGRVITEFLTPVSHAGANNTIACAVGHHVAEGRWLSDRELLDEYLRFWFYGGEKHRPVPHFHNFSSWMAVAVWERYLVTGDREFTASLLDDLVADYHQWVAERGTQDGMFWQYDVRDGMEESISGGRKTKNIRPTINSYMAANANAIAKIAGLAERDDLAVEFRKRGAALQEAMTTSLWDDQAKFFKVRFENGRLSDVREAIGYIPWRFELAGAQHAEAWRQIHLPDGFKAPFGLTTAERRHPKFRTHGTGTCEWDGAVWPFATSQTLDGLARLLRGTDQPYVNKRDYFDQLRTYARSHQLDGKSYIGEYHDETTGQWLITGPKSERSRYYNHSTFCDLVIGGLVGILPRPEATVMVAPLLPDDAWDWFCLDRVPYHGRLLTVVWDRDGRRYGKGNGLMLWIDGRLVARSDKLESISGNLQ